jgi:hypothetical protein
VEGGFKGSTCASEHDYVDISPSNVPSFQSEEDGHQASSEQEEKEVPWDLLCPFHTSLVPSSHFAKPYLISSFPFPSSLGVSSRDGLWPSLPRCGSLPASVGLRWVCGSTKFSLLEAGHLASASNWM